MTPENVTGFFEGIGESFVSFFDKPVVEEQVAVVAEEIAREEVAIAKGEVAPAPASAPTAVPAPAFTPDIVEPERSWAARYAPHLILGGLGVGAVVVLVLALGKKD
jgi:hypothetical protein